MAQAEDERRPLVEIVPNFSEGRRQDVIDAIIDALLVPGLRLLNKPWDPDHNRLHATLERPRDAVRASALEGGAKATALIDIAQHKRSHRRRGKVDAMPFLAS